MTAIMVVARNRNQVFLYKLPWPGFHNCLCAARFAAGCNARITREMWLLGPAAIQSPG